MIPENLPPPIVTSEVKLPVGSPPNQIAERRRNACEVERSAGFNVNRIPRRRQGSEAFVEVSKNECSGTDVKIVRRDARELEGIRVPPDCPVCPGRAERQGDRAANCSPPCKDNVWPVAAAIVGAALKAMLAVKVWVVVASNSPP